MAGHKPKVRVYTRSDGKYGWTLYGANGRKMATDHGQGFRDPADAIRSFRRVEWLILKTMVEVEA